MTIITALIPVAIVELGHIMVKYTKTPDRLQALMTLVDAGVVFAEKMGATKKLEGSEQFKVAYDFVVKQLANFGFTKTDEQLIKSLIEQSWAKQRQDLNTIYEGTKHSLDEQQLLQKRDELKQKEQELANSQQELAGEREQVKSLVSSLNQVLNAHQADPQADSKEHQPAQDNSKKLPGTPSGD